MRRLEEALLLCADLLDVELVEARVVVAPGSPRGAGRGPARTGRLRRPVFADELEACSKCAGVGRICASSPGSASLGHSRCAVARASCSSSAPADLHPAGDELAAPPRLAEALAPPRLSGGTVQ